MVGKEEQETDNGCREKCRAITRWKENEEEMERKRKLKRQRKGKRSNGQKKIATV